MGSEPPSAGFASKARSRSGSPEHLAGRGGVGARTWGVRGDRSRGRGLGQLGGTQDPEWEWGELGLSGDCWSVSRLGQGESGAPRMGWGFLLGGLRISVTHYQGQLLVPAPLTLGSSSLAEGAHFFRGGPRGEYICSHLERRGRPGPYLTQSFLW